MSDVTASHLRAVEEDDAVPGVAEQAEPERPGVTPPSLGGASSRYLTDVLVDLGFCERKRADRAIEEGRSEGVPPERVLLDQHAITPEQLSRAIAERNKRQQDGLA